MKYLQISQSLTNDSIVLLKDSISHLNQINNYNSNEIWSFSFWSTSIALGVISSIVFLLIMYFIKPRIKISDKICKTTFNGKTYYIVKVINKSLWSIYDISAELSVGTPFNGNKGTHTNYNNIALHKDKVFYVPGFKSKFMFWKEDKADYALLFATSEDLETIWGTNTDNKSIHFRVMCRHGLSGFSRVIKQKYYTRSNNLVHGQFEWGNSMKHCN